MGKWKAESTERRMYMLCLSNGGCLIQLYKRVYEEHFKHDKTSLLLLF